MMNHEWGGGRDDDDTPKGCGNRLAFGIFLVLMTFLFWWVI